ncbi:MAG TPA: AAA family ATPase, partial [Phycisphaerae bacterium]|nr:AAA family ATPase [Phycisphaerae bacterium]
MKKATISTVEITNVRGIDYLEFPVASLTLFTGGNAEGKSSALDAFRALFDGPFSHDPSLIRTGTDKATVLATLSNGTTMLRTMTLKRSTLDIRTVDGGKVRREAEFVKQLATGFAFDPLKFLSLKLKEQAQEFMKVMPIMFQPEELAGITAQVQPINLERLNSIRAGMYEDRTKYNVLAKELDGSVADLQKSIPPDSGVDWAGTRDDLGGQLRQKRNELRQAESGAEISLAAATKELERVANDQIRDIREKLAENIQAAAAESNKFLREQTTTLQADLELATTRHATAREKAESATMARALKAQLKKAI